MDNTLFTLYIDRLRNGQDIKCRDKMFIITEYNVNLYTLKKNVTVTPEVIMFAL